MTVAQLGIKVSVDGAAQATVDLDKLDASAIKAEKGAGSLGRASKELSGSLQAITSVLQSIDRNTSAMASAMAQAAAATARLDTASDSAAAAINAAATAAARMVSEQRGATSATTAAVTAAQRLVTVTNAEAAASRELASALNAEKSAAMAAATAMNARAAANDNRGNSGYASNIGAQVQDTFVSAIGGMSATQIAFQQGTQLAAVLTDLRAQGLSTGSALASAFAGVLSPISLATIGVVGLSAALIQYVSGASEVDKLDDKLKEHAANISALRSAYGEALEAAHTYAKESEAVIRATSEASAKAIRMSLKSMTSDIASELEASLATAPFEAAFAGYEQFEGAIKALSEAAKNGQPGILAFRQAVVEIASARPSDKLLQDLRDRFLALTKQAAAAELAVEGSNRAIAETGRVASGQLDAINAYGSALLALSNIALPDLTPKEMASKQLERALANAGGEKWREDMAYQQYQDALTRIDQREGEKRAEQAAERAVREAKQQEEALARRVETIQQSLMTEHELEMQAYSQRMEDLADFYEGKTELDAEYLNLKELAEQDHAAKMEEIDRKLADKRAQIDSLAWQRTADMFGSLSQLAAQFGDKNLIAAKSFGIAEAVINTAVGITEALKLPPPLGWAQAAAVAAAGAAQIATIASARPNSARTPTVSGGGGYGGGYSAGGGPAVQTPKNDNALPNTAYLQITGKGTMTMDEVRELAEKIVDLQKDGFKLVVGS